EGRASRGDGGHGSLDGLLGQRVADPPAEHHAAGAFDLGQFGRSIPLQQQSGRQLQDLGGAAAQDGGRDRFGLGRPSHCLQAFQSGQLLSLIPVQGSQRRKEGAGIPQLREGFQAATARQRVRVGGGMGKQQRGTVPQLEFAQRAGGLSANRRRAIV